MQQWEAKSYDYEQFLLRKALTEKEAFLLLKKFECSLAGKSGNLRLTNVVEDNNRLRSELRDAISELNRKEARNKTLLA